jgi:Domain of unknown function (DUF5710)
MRINLKCPYDEKDEAKSLGARWDAGRKVWYIEDVDDLMPFAKWIPLLNRNTPDMMPRKKESHAVVITHGLNSKRPYCACNTLPWEDCQHTDQEAQLAMQDILDLPF